MLQHVKEMNPFTGLCYVSGYQTCDFITTSYFHDELSHSSEINSVFIKIRFLMYHRLSPCFWTHRWIASLLNCFQNIPSRAEM